MPRGPVLSSTGSLKPHALIGQALQNLDAQNYTFSIRYVKNDQWLSCYIYYFWWLPNHIGKIYKLQLGMCLTLCVDLSTQQEQLKVAAGRDRVYHMYIYIYQHRWSISVCELPLLTHWAKHCQTMPKTHCSHPVRIRHTVIPAKCG